MAVHNDFTQNDGIYNLFDGLEVLGMDKTYPSTNGFHHDDDHKPNGTLGKDNKTINKHLPQLNGVALT